ncbi:MAG: class I SAM-dependent rRNA methyltransferase [Bacteroidales bacterium]|nr:class I SAM-dependent rRNA methyltransferase [Bacteroidales bacterium]MCF8328066.1 class I SAM-dependent rRNA methyltransferase [Bacteroidales bacterium]
MQEKAKVILKTKKAEAVRRFHPWVFSGAIKDIEGHVSNGSIVDVYSNKMKYLATGHYQESSIAVRLFSWNAIFPDREYWQEKMERAYRFREKLFGDFSHTNAFRLVFAEGDGMPGLIIDVYNDIAVFQTHSAGMHQIKSLLVELLQDIMGGKIAAVYDKSSDTMQRIKNEEPENGFLFGDKSRTTIKENNIKFYVDVEKGQKTGFFLDQRENRKLLREYSKGQKVLNMYSYTGGFSVYALDGDASYVESVDSSAKAMDLTDENITLNNLKHENHKSITTDALDYLKDLEKNSYDIIVLDPPAFAKSRSSRHNAVQGYKRINALAIDKIKPGGLLFTFSCSMVIDRTLFLNTVTAAAIQSGRAISVLHSLSQPADHPSSIFHPEGNYLKGLVLKIE